MIVGLSSALVGGTAGLVLGVGSAYFGGKTDLILQRVFDVVMAFPLIIMALAVVAIFGTGVQNVIVAITIPLIPRCARVVRSSALAIREVPYVDAARALGFGHVRIILCHMVPNVMAPFLIMVTAFVGQAVLAEASLSYLGLGVQEPVPAWGLMLQGGAEEYASTAPWIAIFPGVAIVLVGAGDQPVRRRPARYVGSQVAQEIVSALRLAEVAINGNEALPATSSHWAVAVSRKIFNSYRRRALRPPTLTDWQNCAILLLCATVLEERTHGVLSQHRGQAAGRRARRRDRRRRPEACRRRDVLARSRRPGWNTSSCSSATRRSRRRSRSRSPSASAISTIIPS